jgi:choline kinase
LNIHAIIPAAGMGTRIGDSAAGEPKSLLRIDGESLLARALDGLRTAGIERATVIVGYGAETVHDALAGLSASMELDFAHNPDYATTEHGYSLFCAREAWRRQARPVLLLDADNVVDPALLARLLRQPAPDCVLVDPSLDCGTRDEELVLGRARQVTGFVRGRTGDFADYVGAFVGMNLFSAHYMSELFELMHGLFASEGRMFKYERVFHRLIEEHGLAPEYLDTAGLGWVNVNHPEDVDRARRLVAACGAAAQESTALCRSGTSSATSPTA